MPEVNIPVGDAQNAAFDQRTNSLYVLNEKTSSLEKIGMVETGLSVSATGVNTQFNVNTLDLQDAKGMTFDPSGHLFVLDSSGAQIITITPEPVSGFDGDSAARDGRIKRIDLTKLGPGKFQEIAFNPNNKHLYSFKIDEQKLYEFTENAQFVSSYDLSSLGLVNPKTLLFAPSGDVTDDPANMNMFILDGDQTPVSRTTPVGNRSISSEGSIKNGLVAPVQTTSSGGQLVEVSFDALALVPPSNLLPTTLIQTIDTSNVAWNPSSPDPAGIAYWPSQGTLLVSDSEVDEMPPYFTGDNIFESSLTGTLLDTCSTTNIDRNGWSNEPTGVAINPNNNHIFFSDDSLGGKLNEVNPGQDGIYCTPDDTVTTVSAPGSGDAEGIAYGANKLFIAGGFDREVYMFDLGLNGVLGGGDDGPVTSFDTEILGFQNVEGIEYSSDQGTLFIVSDSRSDQYIGEISLSGTLINAFNLDYLGNVPRSGLAYGPSSRNPAIKSIYLTSRGVDNNVDPLENDGKVWEIYLGEIQIDNEAPIVHSVTRIDTSPTAATNVDFTVTFSEAVTGVDIGAPFADFALTTTGAISGATVTGVVDSSDHTSYTVTVNTGSGNGTLRLDVVDNNSILDSFGNLLGGPGVGNGNFTSGEAYNVINTATFSDAPASYWAWNYIEAIYLAGITGGCGASPLIYCPEDTVTRAQMAVFLEKGIHGSGFAAPVVPISFTDTGGHWAQYWIEALKTDGITGGCGAGIYCPENPVTRAQMAVLLLKSKHGAGYLPPAVGAGTGFNDVPLTHWAAAWIKQLAAEGITGGCGSNNYCPEDPVTRAQMAVFLQRTFNLPMP